MKKRKKIFIGIIIVLAIILLSVVGYRLLNRKSIEEVPEILRSRTYEQVEEGDETIDGTDYVTFDAYYLRDLNGDGYAEKLRGTCREIGTQDTLYMDLNVLTNGTLKNGKITINGENFRFSTALVKDSVIAQDYISSDTKEIKLNDLNAGTQKLIFGIVQSGDYTRNSLLASAIGNDTNKYNVDTNTITLTGTHVSDEGVETEISKTVYLTNDWYGTTQASIYSTSQTYESLQDALDEENQKVTISFNVYPNEIKEQLILQKNHTDITIPQLNGYDPISVTTTTQNVASSYDEQTHIFTMEKTSQVNENSIITTSLSRNLSYNVTVVYPYEAYNELGQDTIVLSIPMETYFEGYNNPNDEFENPYKSNIAKDIISVTYKNPEGRAAIVEVTVGKYTSENGYTISKELPLNIYNQIEAEEQEDIYPVTWYAYTGTEAINAPLILKETPENYTDRFQNVNNEYIDMLKYTFNVGIYFSNPQSMLGEEGYINVYNDETNELIHTFTKDDWSNYTANSPYRYKDGIKHIRIETSNVNASSSLYVYHLKQIDDVLLTAEFSREEFENLSKIYSYLTGYFKIDNSEELIHINSDVGIANYLAPYSKASIYVNPDYFSNQETKYNEKITISTDTTSFNTKKWTNGVFLIKYPKEIINAEITSVIPSDKGITITAVDTYTENGNIYTKIYTENEVEKNVYLTIDANLTADPRTTTATRTISMYYYNPGCHNYKNISKDEYDLNGDSNIQENMGISSTSINLIAPSNLLTSQTATNFDDKGSIVIAPQDAEINKIDGSRTADINVSITNNYASTISEIKIVGSIPFEGNKYQLNKQELGSEFTTTLLSEINIPDDLKPYATVYYSEKEEVTEDINAAKNGWTTEPENMSKVKSYLISLGDYVLPVGKNYEFSYKVQVPSGVKYNEVSYSDHAVYYCLDTDQGKLKTQTEPNKLGIRIAEKYDLEITKTEINSDRRVSQTVFVAQDEESNSITATTNKEGIATIKNLYAEKEYVIKEIKANNNYIRNDEEIRIIGHVVDGQLQIEILEGKFKDAPVIEVVENNNTKVKVGLEDEVKYNFELNKTQIGTEAPIQGIRFELKNENTGSIKRYTTNEEGKLTIKLLEPNIQYTLTEIESQGHYLKEPVSFMMVRGTDRNLKFNVLSGDLDTLPQIDTSGEVPVVRTGLANEKIPTYSLRVTKKETDTDTTIAGAQFKLIGENKEDNILYTTDENGIVQIDNLYQFVEGKNVTGVYTLQEIFPTEGYILNEIPVEFRAQKDGAGNLKLEIISGTIRENVDEIQVDNTNPDNPVISITIDNDPVFTLTKMDAQTKEPLEGVGFEVTNLDGNPVKDANGKYVGLQELVQVDLLSTGNYQWTQNEDGTWQSGNQGINYTTSTLTSESFTIEEDALLSFDWSVSSYTSNYLYVTVTNLDNNTTIGGNKNDYRISGTTRGTEYESLIYDTKEIELTPGTYKVEFKYYRNYSTVSGLDTGYVKNVKVISKDKTVKTDKDGKIRLSLVEGLYKATETKPLEGYATPELYTGIGIGESKEAEYDLRFEWENAERIYAYNDVIAVEDGVIAVGERGAVVKYDLEGNIIWENTEKEYYYYYGVIAVEDGVIAVGEYGGNYGKVVKYDLEGNIEWENKNTTYYHYMEVVAVEDGVIAVGEAVAKYDFNGNLIWENTVLGHNYFIDCFDDVTIVKDGVIAVSGAGVTKYDFDGNIVWNNTDVYQNSQVVTVNDGVIVVGNYGGITKCDFNGNVIWKNSISENVRSACTIDDGMIIGAGQLIIKCDLEGNKVWENNEKNYNYTEITTVEDGIIAVSADGKVVKYQNHIKDPAIPNATNIVVENEIAKYKITTKVDGFGGNISGKNEQPYEEVIYLHDSTKDIIATPSEGYKVQSITINGNPIDFIENSDGTVKLDKFYQMTEDKEIIVSFVKVDSSLIIEKIDSTTLTGLSNAIFNIQTVETRDDPTITDIVGSIVANGQEYVDSTTTLEDEVIDFEFGSLTNNGTYYFVEENGKYVPNNSGKGSTTANSYVKIDLTNYEGSYALVVNANISSENNYDYGYATIAENTTAPVYSNSTGRFIYITGTSSSVTAPTDYSVILEGGKIYYLHLGYRKDGSGNSGEDKFTVNSIKLYNAIVSTITNTYNFVDNGNGGYESNNQGVASTVANSYIPLDLTNYTGKYTLIVNANVSSQSSDYGYATVTTTTTAPAYNNSTGRFIYISGTSSSVTNPKDYTTVLEGGKIYYLHFGYYKNSSSDSGEDKFTINSINIELNQDNFIDEDYVTNANGEAIINDLPEGRYKITEVQAPEGYTLNPEPIVYDMVVGQENKITVENDPQVDIIVHHYIKDTTTSVAPDEYIKGDLGKEYSTSPKTDLEEYELVKNEDGSYQIPENASGVFTEETQVVTYYYEKKPLQLIVHHYIDGTEDSVAPDEESRGEKGDEYETSSVKYPALNEKYELVQEKFPSNASGHFEESVTEVIYYYKIKEYKITTEVEGVGGTISGEGQTPYETVLHEEDSVKDIIITPNEGYQIESIIINGEEQELPEDKLAEYTLDKFINMVEDKHIVVRFEPLKGNIYVDKIWEDNSNSAGKRPKEIEIQLYNGNTLVSSLKMNEEDNGGQLAPVSLEGNAQVTNGWGAKFENIPMYDESGNQINYTVVEKEVNTNDLYFYETNIEQTGGDVFTITNTFNVPEETIDIEVTKKWEDSSNENGLRPQEIKLQLKNGEEVVQEQVINVESGNEQRYTFTGLDKYDENGNEIRYTVDESEVNEEDLKFYSKQIDNEKHAITNTFTVPDEKISIEVTKKWEDESNVNETRPSQIVIQVKNGEEVVQSNTVDVTEEDEKVYTFTDLAKYDENGKEIEYIVDETEVNKDELIGYEKKIDGKVITNTIKSHKITTEVKGEGGTISGQDEDPYEEVLHKGDSVKDIVITPNEGYEIAKITINGEEQELPENIKEEYTLDKFKEVTEDKHVVVEFKKIEYKITTEVEGDGGIISGEGEIPYESVVHGENSVKDIICTPEYGYKIESITVNGESIEFRPDEEDNYTLDKFINMTEDKHIIVKYVKKDTSVTVKHVTEEGVDLVEPKTIEGKVGDPYDTEPKEFDEYEIKIIPENADGEMEEEQIEVIYVYSQIKGKVTITKVDKDDTSKLLEGATYKIEKVDEEGNVDGTFATQEKTTGENGQVEFVDLTVGKYNIVEIKAPEGYELNKSDIEVEITKEQRELSLTATNMLKLGLPETGSVNNTIIIAIVGIAIMIGAVTLSKKFKLK